MKQLRIHCFQHVHFEDPGCITDWVNRNGHTLSFTRFFEDRFIPLPEQYDWLIVMGGPMGVYDEEKYPWLTDEKKAIKQAIELGKKVLGICLGAQLIAHVLGAKVFKNPEKEIGWFRISLTRKCKNENLLYNSVNSRHSVFHWHGDTFDLPPGAVHLASSDGCINQAFLYNGKVLGLQFHLEVIAESIITMVQHGRQELVKGNYVQSENEILTQRKYIDSNNQRMFKVLNNLYKQ